MHCRMKAYRSAAGKGKQTTLSTLPTDGIISFSFFGLVGFSALPSLHGEVAIAVASDRKAWRGVKCLFR
jgi:hypothetical protein